ncbi:hypothetical protein [Ovoidimarina sediminis]|uniref:hypothetical protein n=1 Tax=Ovoidimarina sediminis TaxID=3079856 RepID=UPI00290CC1EE|nr:hypothetical protein [Rhodophyticola sp. MJ-SS7]MDU8946559.1 hypothetical protein [Rhodophyticola sp. MJ-SS7]
MEKHISSARNQDAIDWFTEELTRDPARAEHLKQALRRKIGLEPASCLREVPRRRPVEDPDDYWDNVPV